MKRISKTEIKEMRSQSKKNSIMFAFTLPTVILYTIFFSFFFLIGVYYSFTDWNGISKDYTFVGLKNYVKVLTDERFREALWFNIGYTIALVVLLIVIPLTIALALNRIRRLSTLFRSIYFIPAVISMVTVGLIWNELFYRAVPAIGEMLNIEALSTSPLGNPKLAAIAIMVVNIWQGCAIPTVLFIAGLQSVPKDLLEAATIDGAGNWARFWNVIIPYLIPVLNMVIITQAKAGLTVFDYIKVMTNGGPAQSTEAVGLLIYRHAINEGKFSTSVAESMILFVIVGVVSAFSLRLRSKSSRILKILSYVLLITGMIVILYPFYLTIITALKTPQESSQSFFSFPQSFYLGNFVHVLQKANYFVFFRNSAVVTLVSVFLIMVLIPMCSYAIARNMEKRYYKTMYFYLLAGIFVPFQVIMVPLVKYLAKLKLCNIPGLIIMCVTLASSQGVFLLVNYIRSVPRDLEEAAYIDGCGTVKAYVKIVLPMIKPILATIFVLNALWVWNDFQMPLLILNQSQDMWTLPLFQYNTFFGFSTLPQDISEM